MGGFFGAVSRRDVVIDTFFGVDYHTHLGTNTAGMVVFDAETGFQRQIHNIQNTPFRTRFEDDLRDFHGNAAIGCISDATPQPLLVRSQLGTYAIATVGRILLRPPRSAGGAARLHFGVSPFRVTLHCTDERDHY